jgi:two-component system, LytTR family, response regulator
MTAIIVDDEQYSGEALFLLLRKYCPEVKILAIESSPEQAIILINKMNPDIVFLDIELQSINGFSLLDKIEVNCGVIFTTAFDHYAVNAFKVEAIDYLLKPIDGVELVKAVEKAKRFLTVKPRGFSSPNVYLENISLNSNEGTIFIKTEEIIRCEAEGSYSQIYFTNKQKLTVTKNLGALEKSFLHTTLKRVHKSHVINLKHVSMYIKGEGGEALMANGDKVPIARDKKDDFLQMMNSM